MTNREVDDEIHWYAAKLHELGHEKERWPAGRAIPTPNEGIAYRAALRHALWLCGEALKLPAGEYETKERLLGFVQGILFVTGVMRVSRGTAIEEVK